MAVRKTAVAKTVKAPVTPATSTTPTLKPWEVVEQITRIDISLVPDGSRVKGTIHNRRVDGIIIKDNLRKAAYVLTNNTHLDGASPVGGPSVYGKYRYSYGLGYGESDLISKLKISDPVPGFKMPMVIAGYVPKIEKGFVKFGCKTVTNEQVRELAALLKD